MHLILLIFCVVLPQAIVGTISNENISKSSELLVRNKRVLNFEPGGDVPAQVGEFPFVVNIELHNVTHCVGSIISDLTVITSVLCASAEIFEYKILSGSTYTKAGSARSVVEKKIRLGNYVGRRSNDGIALFIVDAHFTSRFTEVIELHRGPLVTGTPATVAGWGCYYVSTARGTAHAKKLRSITVPIMPHQQCVDIYRGTHNITDEDVCIFDEHKHCGHTDSGAPLIINGQLAGVYLRRGPHPLRIVPEVFAALQHNHYGQWIRNNIVRRL